MTEKELKKFNIVEQIRKRHTWKPGENDREKVELFYTIDGGFSGDVETINLFETSGNLCFRFDYYPTASENIYHNIFIEDWTTKKRYKAGYIYFKTYTGYLTAESMKELKRICDTAQAIISEVFDKIA